MARSLGTYSYMFCQCVDAYDVSVIHQPFDHHFNGFRMLNIYALYSRVFISPTVAHLEEKPRFYGASFRNRQK